MGPHFHNTGLHPRAWRHVVVNYPSQLNRALGPTSPVPGARRIAVVNAGRRAVALQLRAGHRPTPRSIPGRLERPLDARLAPIHDGSPQSPLPAMSTLLRLVGFTRPYHDPGNKPIMSNLAGAENQMPDEAGALTSRVATGQSAPTASVRPFAGRAARGEGFLATGGLCFSFGAWDYAWLTFG